MVSPAESRMRAASKRRVLKSNEIDIKADKAFEHRKKCVRHRSFSSLDFIENHKAGVVRKEPAKRLKKESTT